MRVRVEDMSQRLLRTDNGPISKDKRDKGENFRVMGMVALIDCCFGG